MRLFALLKGCRLSFFSASCERTFPELEFLMERNVRHIRAGAVLASNSWTCFVQFSDCFCCLNLCISWFRASICSALSWVICFLLSLSLDFAKALISGVEFGS